MEIVENSKKSLNRYTFSDRCLWKNLWKTPPTFSTRYLYLEKFSTDLAIFSTERGDFFHRFCRLFHRFALVFHRLEVKRANPKFTKIYNTCGLARGGVGLDKPRTVLVKPPPRGRIRLAIQNGVAGIWYSHAVGHPVSARRGFLQWLPDEA